MGLESPGSVRTRVGNWFDWCLRVRYAETDAQRIVHHAEYLVYMEEARCELVRALGLSYRTLEERGLSLVVTEAQLRYSSPAEFDDRLRVRARISRVRSREVVFEYRIEHVESGRLGREEPPLTYSWTGSQGDNRPGVDNGWPACRAFRWTRRARREPSDAGAACVI